VLFVPSSVVVAGLATPGQVAQPVTRPLDAAPQLRHHHLVEKLCAQCGAAMTCQQEAGCWCAELPKIPMPANDEGCLCRTCLLAKIEALQRAAKSNQA
jgi:hypothetical protein